MKNHQINRRRLMVYGLIAIEILILIGIFAYVFLAWE